MGVSRKLMRVQLNKQRKEAKTQFKQMTRVIDNMQKSCISCGAEFDNKNPEHLDNWRVNVFEDHAELYCDKCYTPSVDSENMENTDEQGTATKTV